MMQHNHHLRILRRTDVLARLRISSTTLHNRINAQLFPPPVSLGGRLVGWLDHEIDQAMAFLAAGKSNEQVRELVGDLVIQRKSLT